MNCNGVELTVQLTVPIVIVVIITNANCFVTVHDKSTTTAIADDDGKRWYGGDEDEWHRRTGAIFAWRFAPLLGM